MADAAPVLNSLEEIYFYSLPNKEFEIIDFYLGSRDGVFKIMPVQKHIRAYQRTRFKAFGALVTVLYLTLKYQPVTSARGSTDTLGNFAKATYGAITMTYAYLTPERKSVSIS
ncbi:small ribosomal subunit protein uS5-like [Haematobia irritans]|uniref:small ribosomal subunit protein uS5-like n=1 Tax=Haematobia irritans TaxID=7368 RepID=UPI003F4FE88B